MPRSLLPVCGIQKGRMAVGKPRWEVTILLLALLVSTAASPVKPLSAVASCHRECARGVSLCIVQLCTWVRSRGGYNECRETCEKAGDFCENGCKSGGSSGGVGNKQSAARKQGTSVRTAVRVAAAAVVLVTNNQLNRPW